MKSLRNLAYLLLLSLLFSCSTKISSLHTSTDVAYDDPRPDSTIIGRCDSIMENLNESGVNNAVDLDSKDPPTTLDESLLRLQQKIPPEMNQWIICLPDGEFSVIVHHSFGTYLRNSWGLWKNSKLAHYFYERGIFHPDDMSNIILTSYQRRVKEEPIDLDEQIRQHKEYWEKTGMNVDSLINRMAGKAELE